MAYILSSQFVLATNDLTDYFNDWLYGQGYPNYTITWSKDALCNKVYVTINQTHSANLGTFFEMKVPLKFSNGAISETVVFDQNAPTTLTFDHLLGFAPTTVTFDPDKWLCAKATITEVPFDNHRHIIWNGNVDNNWHNGANWDCGVPTAADDATIPAGMRECIIYQSQTANCRKLHVTNTGSLTTQNKAFLIIHQ